jgi:hypothetical protein
MYSILEYSIVTSTAEHHTGPEACCTSRSASSQRCQDDLGQPMQFARPPRPRAYKLVKLLEAKGQTPHRAVRATLASHVQRCPEMSRDVQSHKMWHVTSAAVPINLKPDGWDGALHPRSWLSVNEDPQHCLLGRKNDIKWSFKIYESNPG